ncbi:MAG: hypothetical protein A2V88_08660 [Elusimicrobia bacterium RBG_16_66_12]|nr:MAG: hypothetical protein A2V88_08660 [Elusimicrobia bacterium RBG_16_66_12]
MICQKCGAFKGHYGCEPSVAMYVEHTIEVLRAIRRMLRPDGVLWWDLDDSRSGTNDRASFRPGAGRADGKVDSRGQRNRDGSPSSGLPPPKSLCLIPQRIAIAAADDGWTVRSQIVIAAWMPESAKDRPTDSYRVLLMLTRSKKYWYDGWAVRVTAARDFQDYERHTDQGQEARGGRLGVFTDGSYSNQGSPDGLRKLGNCWTDIPPAAHPSSPSFRHFAVMPIAEAERAILASVPEAICTKCGKPRVRMVKTKAMVIDRSDGAAASGIRTLPSGTMVEAPQAEAVGWTTCDCGAPFEPGAVLDCFAGTGTTGVAAQKLGRKAILIELSDDYCRQAVTRLTVGDKGIRTLAAAENAGAEQGRML